MPKDSTKKNQNDLKHMTLEEFRSAGYATIDWLVEYMADMEKNPITPSVSPGDVRSMLSDRVPEEGEPYAQLLEDMTKIIKPGLTLWQHPGFYGYFSANSSPPAILGDLLSTGLGVQGMLWATGPAITELETHVLDLLADLCGLPSQFKSSGSGGGVIQDSASSATLCAILAARESLGGTKKISNFRAYVSVQSHSSAEKDLLVAGIGVDQIRKIETDENFRMCPKALERAIKSDLEAGFTPFFVLATVGTTSSGAIDDVERIAKVGGENGAWIHVDAAWAGSAAVCPEFRFVTRGLELVDSYVFNPHKWLLTNFDCSAFYVADAQRLTQALSIVPEYLKNKASEAGEVIDYRDWQIPLGRRFRSLKLWFVLRSYGVKGLQAYIRTHVDAAKYFEEEIKKINKIQLFVNRSLSLICFRHLDGNQASKRLLDRLNATGQVLLTHTVLDGEYVLRVAVGGTHTTKDHMEVLVKLIERYV